MPTQCPDALNMAFGKAAKTCKEPLLGFHCDILGLPPTLQPDLKSTADWLAYRKPCQGLWSFPGRKGLLTVPGSQQHCKLWETQLERPGTAMSPALVILTVSPLCPGCPGSPSLPGGPWGKNQSNDGSLSNSEKQGTKVTVIVVAGTVIVELIAMEEPAPQSL
jgi:hypothetical protein